MSRCNEARAWLGEWVRPRCVHRGGGVGERPAGELARNALLQERHVCVSIRSEREYIAVVEGTGGPADPAKETVAVFVQEIECCAKICKAALITTAAARFGKKGLPAAAFEIFKKRGKGVVDTINSAGGVGAREIAVEVLVDVKDWTLDISAGVRLAIDKGRLT